MGVEWTVNGVSQNTPNPYSLTLQDLSKAYVVTVTIYDPTLMIRKDDSNLRTQSITWNVNYGCEGVPFASTSFDECGVCGGDNTSCQGCDGVPNSGLELDLCNVCGGGHNECSDLPYCTEIEISGFSHAQDFNGIYHLQTSLINEDPYYIQYSDSTVKYFVKRTFSQWIVDYDLCDVQGGCTPNSYYGYFYDSGIALDLTNLPYSGGTFYEWSADSSNFLQASVSITCQQSHSILHSFYQVDCLELGNLIVLNLNTLKGCDDFRKTVIH